MVIRVKGWEKYQHYSHRDPPWIKLHKNILTSQAWVLGNDESRLAQVTLTLLAARFENAIPSNYALLQRVASIDMKKSVFEKALIHLAHYEFIELIDESGAAVATKLEMAQRRTPKTRDQLLAEAEAEEAKGEEIEEPPGTIDEVVGLDDLAWRKFDSYRKKIKKPFKPVSISAAQRMLARFGKDQMAVVDQTIERGWVGLFPLKMAGATSVKNFDADGARAAWRALIATRGDSVVKDPISREAVSRIGTYMRVRMARPDQMPFIEKEFIEAYAELKAEAASKAQESSENKTVDVA